MGISASRVVTYTESKLGRVNILSGNRIGLLFTYNSENTADIDDVDLNSLKGSSDLLSNNIVGNGFTANSKGLTATFNPASSNKQVEILMGAGFRNFNATQQINTTAEGGLGFFDILEHVEHNVASNEFVVEKAAFRLGLLAQKGLAPWGKDVITSPLLNCYIYDVKERQRGINFQYLKCIGLHISTNRFSAQIGSAAMENVTFKVDRFHRGTNIPQSLLKEQMKVYPQLYSGVETLESYVYTDL